MWIGSRSVVALLLFSAIAEAEGIGSYGAEGVGGGVGSHALGGISLVVKKSGIAWSPSMLSGLLAWYEADVDTYANAACTVPANSNSQTVLCLKDQSPNHLDLTRSSQGPILTTGSLNSRPTLHFDNPSQLGLINTSFNLGSQKNLSVFFTFRIATALMGSNARVMSFVGAGQMYDFNDATSVGYITPAVNTLDAYRNGIEESPTAVISGNTWYSFGTVWNGSNETSYLSNVAQPSTNDTQTWGSATTLYVGNGFSGGVPTLFITGDIAEIVITTSAMTAADRTNLYDYFNMKWGGGL